MPTNQIYKPNRNLSKVREVGPDVRQGTPVLVDGRPGVTDADSGGSKREDNSYTGVSITHPSGGAGYDEGLALVHRDGTFEFPVVGVDEETPVDTNVYFDDGDLSLDDSGTYFGKIDYPTGYVRKAGRAPVQIGVAE